MRNAAITALLSSLLLAGAAQGGAALAQPAPAMMPARPAADVAKDALRHPQQGIAFAGIKRGDTVIELIPEHGYFTRLLSQAVGPSGKVIAVVPSVMASQAPEERALAAEPGYGNVQVVVEGLGAIATQGPADVVWTSQNYHDLHNEHLPPDAALKIDQAAFAALKPGGVYLIEDHVGAPGTGDTQASTLHRIEPGFVKAEVEKAGFVFDGASDVLANPADPHTAKVFDPSIRGRTDQFVFRFRRPR